MVKTLCFVATFREVIGLNFKDTDDCQGYKTELIVLKPCSFEWKQLIPMLVIIIGQLILIGFQLNFTKSIFPLHFVGVVKI